MSAVVIRPYLESDEDAVVELWRRCDLVVAWNDPRTDIHTKLATQRELFVVATLDERLVGTAMGGFDGHRGWVNYVAVEPGLQRGGVGRALMDAIEAELAALGCPKLNLQVRRWNANAVGFYERLGYRVEDNVSMGKRLGKQ